MVGFGYDVHKLAEGESLILGGVAIDSEIGTVAHSDGDVLLHSIIDALLGAAGLGDIGEHYPDTDPKWENASSVKMAKDILNLIQSEGYRIVNIDAIIVLEKPKLSPLKDKIRESIAKIFQLDYKRVNIKATTSENMGFVGRKEGIAVHSVCQIETV
ncbi:MAG: 2-C-methyl-D-erythritol 2,4-cyclodiphosphate synthase [Candidatus Kapaibacteriales bacterium]